MTEVNKKQYLDLGGLSKYDTLLKEYIGNGNAALEEAIAALNAKIGELDIEGSDDKTVSNAIADIYASLAEILEAQDALGAKDEELAGKINAIVGELEEGEDVAMTLVEINNELKNINDLVSKNATDIAGVDSRVSVLEGTIDDLKNLGGENGLVAVVEKVNKNTEDIVALNAAVAQAQTDVATANTTANEAKDAAAQAQTDAAQAKSDAGNAANDAAAAAESAAAEANAAATAAQVSAESAAAQANTAAESAAAAQASAASADAVANEAKSAAENAGEVAGEAKTLAENAVADATQAKSDAAEAKTAMETLMGEGEGSVQKIAESAAAEAVAAVVAGADSDFDTLREVAEWIGSHKEGAAELQVSVSKNTEDIAALDAKVEVDIANLATHMSDAAEALGELDGRIKNIEDAEETHERIPDTDIEGLFA